jgi:hypothetical protein
MNVSLAPYLLSTSLAQVLGDGARCRTCGVRYSPCRNVPASYCISHGLEMQSDEAKLGYIGVHLQDKFYLESVRQFQVDGRTIALEPAGMTAEELWM